MAPDAQRTPATPRRARHLMDPDAPRVAPSAADQAQLRRVQRWVMSVLAVTTVIHLSVGLAIAGVLIGSDQPEARIGLNVISVAFGMLAVAAGLAIHARPLVSAWLLLGAVPGLVGLVLVLR